MLKEVVEGYRGSGGEEVEEMGGVGGEVEGEELEVMGWDLC